MGNLEAKDSVAEVAIRSNTEDRVVEMWTTRRLPYEPKGALLEARNFLRSQLACVTATNSEYLTAKYLSLQKSFVDTENVLLYNVGSSCFSNCSRSGIAFARSTSKPPNAPNGSTHWKHYHRYSIADCEKIDISQTGYELRLNFEMSKMSTSLKPHHYWWAAKHGVLKMRNGIVHSSTPYRLVVSVYGPRLRSCLAGVIKPLFDGIISSMHFDPNCAKEDKACRWLSREIDTDTSNVANLIRDDSIGLLGPRRIVSEYRNSIKWNPADELCYRGELYFHERDSPKWTIDAGCQAHAYVGSR